MNGIRCINLVKEQASPKGFRQVVTEFTRKNGTSGTEVVTVLNSEGDKGIRTIERDAFGIISSITDRVFGRPPERYVSAYPERKNGIFQYSGNERSYLPDIELKDLCKY